MTYSKVVNGEVTNSKIDIQTVRKEVGGILSSSKVDFSENGFYLEVYASLDSYQMPGDPLLNGVVDEGSKVVNVSPVDLTLAAAKSMAYIYADQEVGSKRKEYITSVPGQEMTYAEKSAEVKLYRLNDPGPFPFLEAEASATGTTVEDLATLIETTRALWVQVGSALEAVRRGFIVATNNATTVSEIRTAKQNFDSALSVL